MDLRGHHDPWGGHVFTSIGSGARPTRTTRSWTSSGVSYTVDTTDFASPGLSFGTMTGSMHGPFRGFTVPTRSSGRSITSGSLLGNAFGMLEDLLSQQQPRQEHFHQHTDSTPIMGRRLQRDVESDTDSDLIYEDYDDHSGGRSMISSIKGFKDKLLYGKHKSRGEREHIRNRDHSHSRERSPIRRQRPERRQSSFRTEVREPQRPQARRRPQSEYIEVDYHDDSDDEPEYVEQRARRTSHVDASMIEALENAVEIERRSARACKKRLEQATRQPEISSNYLQKLVNELKGHEDALTSAQRSLDEAKAKQRRRDLPTRASIHSTRPRQSSRSLEEESFSPFGPGFNSLFANTRSRHPDPALQAFEDMERHAFNLFGMNSPFGLHEQLFEQVRASAAVDDNDFGFFTSAGRSPAADVGDDQFNFFTAGGQPFSSRKRTRHSMPKRSPHTQQQPMPAFTPFAAPPKPPPVNLLRREEAKRLFKAYDERWNTLSTSDPNIPYPARALEAHALSARDTIWAPHCKASVLTWSDETVLQANAQAFYLGVVGLTPRYTESPATGRVEMGFDKSKASPLQIKELVDLLKKERNRWHSDRLGRRNGGSAGPNEVLQKDERARAVFHAVCELLESAQ